MLLNWFSECGEIPHQEFQMKEGLKESLFDLSLQIAGKEQLNLREFWGPNSVGPIER